MNRWVGRGGLVALLAAAACSGKSYAVVTVRAAAGEFSAAQLAVHVANGPGRRDMLYYPKLPAAPFRVSTTETVDFSVSFSSNYLGVLKVGVEPRDGGGSSIGYGEAEKEIDPGEVVHMDVAVVRDALPPVTPTGDGGVVPAACEPTSPTSCGPGNTCYVRCRSGIGTEACAPAGQGQPGRACTENGDCAPGTQCFEYACGKICMKFCKTDGECGQGRCTTNVPCGNTATTHRVCSQPCDPRNDGTVGCEGGLHCFVFDGENPSCDCRGANRGDGESCDGARDCQPGLICVMMEGVTRACRPVCKLSEGICPDNRTCTRLVMPDYRTWGACLP